MIATTAPFRRLLVASSLFALILTLTGAFGSLRIVLPLRLFFWLAVVLAGAPLLARRTGSAVKRSIAADAAVVIVAAAASTLACGLASLLLFSRPFWLIAVELVPASIILNALLLVVLRFDASRPPIPLPTSREADDRVPPIIASKLSPMLARSRIVSVEAQDHYLRVTTASGSALIHMRFADALAALAESDGTQVHRSWWVARTAISSARFANGRGLLRLGEHVEVPVSRKYAARARAMAVRPGAPHIAVAMAGAGGETPQ